MANVSYGFMNGTKYVRTVGDKTSASIRLYEKPYTNKAGEKTTYYEGGVQLANGQWIWVSLGGTLKQKENTNGRVYMNAKVALTGCKARRQSSNFVTG